MHYATFQCGRYNTLKKTKKICPLKKHEKTALKNPPNFFFQYVLPKTTRSAKTVRNPYSFFNVSYTYLIQIFDKTIVVITLSLSFPRNAFLRTHSSFKDTFWKESLNLSELSKCVSLVDWCLLLTSIKVNLYFVPKLFENSKVEKN